MKFSVSPAGGTTAEVVAAAQLAEELGYDAFWVADSHILRREVYVLLAAAACATKRIALGPGVTHPLVRHLTLTASAIAGLDDLAPGRVRLGIGVGDSGPASMGMRRSTLKELEEAIVALHALLRGQEARWQDQTFKLGQKADHEVPVYVAGASLRTQEMTGRVADGMMWGGALDDLPEALATIRQAETSVGRATGAVQAIMWTTACIDEDRERARAAVLQPVARKVIWSLGAKARRGRLDPEDKEPLERLMKAYDERQHQIPDDKRLIEDRWIDRFALAGHADEVLARCRQIDAQGAGEIGVIFRGVDGSRTAASEQLTRFAEGVIRPMAS